MPKYMFQASYTSEGVRGLLEVGGTARANVLGELAKDMGGKVEAFYYAFGEDDIYCIVDLPDDASAAAISLRVSAGGAATVKTTTLLDPSVIDEAAKKSVDYSPPGA